MSILTTPRLRLLRLPIAAAVSLSALVACTRDAAAPTPTTDPSPVVAAKAEAARIYVCPMHPHITSHAPGQCPICGMDLVLKTPPPGATRPSPESGVVLSAAVRQTLGIRTATVSRRDLRPTLKVPARVVADAGGEWRLQSRVDGFVERLHVRAAGTRLGAGAVVAEIYAPELVQAQEELLLGGDAVEAARERLRRYGIAEADIAAVRAAGVSSRALPLRAPAAGIVTAVEVREGSRVGMDDVIVAMSTQAGLRVEAHLFPAQRPWLGADIEAHFTQPGVPEAHWRGRDPQWLSALDPTTQTVGLRFRVDATEALAIGTLLDAELLGALRERVLRVPAEAVIRTADGDRVLREQGEGTYVPVTVRTGQRFGDELEIVDGLADGDRVVVAGQFLVDSEAQLQSALSRLQVGAAAHDHD